MQSKPHLNWILQTFLSETFLFNEICLQLYVADKIKTHNNFSAMFAVGHNEDEEAFPVQMLIVEMLCLQQELS